MGLGRRCEAVRGSWPRKLPVGPPPTGEGEEAAVNELHVVFGAKGALGAAVVHRLAKMGVPVRAVVREDEKAHCALPGHAEVFYADPLHRRRAIEAAKGASVVYRCISASYAQWTEQWAPMTENIIAAAHENSARLVSPGNVYVYGPLQSIPAGEDHPLAATGEKGRLRIATQQMLLSAHRSGTVPVVIPRFPDTYGPGVLDRVCGELFHHAARGELTRWFGDPDVPRDLVFVEDAARACILLGGREEAFGQAWHVPGPGPLKARDFIRLVYSEAGHHCQMGRTSPLSVRLEAMFNHETRAFLEFRYLFEQPLVLDGSRFAAAFPEFTYTTHAEAVRQTLAWFRRHYIS
jgi:nucleoside-diphosphate-sugar epimerase